MKLSFHSILFFFFLVLGGCTPRPWGSLATPLQEESGRHLFTTLQNQQRSCFPCLIADIKIVAKNHFGHRAVQGYIELMEPYSLKFIVNNPFGQPLFAFAGNEKGFQLINTRDRLATQGNLEQFCAAFDLPATLANNTWPLWLMARLPLQRTPLTIRTDKDNRGLWFSFPESKDNKEEFLLVDPSKQRLITRIIRENEQNVLRLDYSYPEGTSQQCLQPTDIIISELDFGTTATITISHEEQSNDCHSKHFQIPTPANYTHTTLR